MRPSEAAQVLATASAFDRRTVGQADAEAWAAVLDDVPLADAIGAVKTHYATKRDFIYPADITHIVKAVRAERVRAAGNLEARIPAAIDAIDDPVEHTRQSLAWLRETARRVGNGEDVESFAPRLELVPADRDRVEALAGSLAESLKAPGTKPRPQKFIDEEQCADCGQDMGALVHGNTGREHDHTFVAPTDHQPTHRPEGTRG